MKTPRQWWMLVVLAGMIIASSPAFANTWDIAAQFTTTANPNGQWSYGFDNTVTDPPAPYVGYNFTLYDTFFADARVDGEYDTWQTSFDFNDAGVLNPSKPKVFQNLNAGGPYQGKVTAKAYWRPLNWNNPPYTGEVKEKPSIIRWTCPASGYYTFSGYFLNVMGATNAGYGLVLNASTELMYTRQLSGYAPTNISRIAMVRQLNGGDTMDFIGRQPYVTGSLDYRNPETIIDATIRDGQWAVSGFVRTSGGVALSGATVTNTAGTETCTTGTDGSYLLPILSAATFNIMASMPGYVSSTQSVTIDGVTTKSKDFSLTSGAVISGTVTDNNILSHPGLPGVAVTSTDSAGTYSTTTNSAGFYSIQVGPGNWTLKYYLSGFAVKLVPVNTSGGGNVTANVALDHGWDFAADFDGYNNPAANTPWSYGYANGSAYTPGAYTRMPNNAWYGVQQSTDRTWWDNAINPGFNGACFFKNKSNIAIDQWTGYYGWDCYREPSAVGVCPSAMQNRWAVARFTASTSGYYKVVARFGGASHDGISNHTITNEKVGLMLNGSYLLPVSPIQGFQGRSINNYTDSASTGTPVYQYTGDINFQTGDQLDALVFNDATWPMTYDGNGGYYGSVSPGWTQVDVTISKENTAIAGRVLSSLPGNPPLAGATVVANGARDPWPTYQTLTDANGYYLLSVMPNSYHITATSTAGYPTPATADSEVAAGTTLTENFTLTHAGTWDLSHDFCAITNPFGQWSFGYYDDTAHGQVVTPSFRFVPINPANNTPSMYGMQSWAGAIPDYTYYQSGTGWLALNGNNPTHWTDGTSTVGYVEPNRLSFGGVDNWNDAPAIRWTAPDTRVIKFDLTIASQFLTRPIGGSATVSIFRNGIGMAQKSVSGFAGSYASGYTDSVAGGPTATFETTLSVNSGDTIDMVCGKVGDIYNHWAPNFAYPPRSVDIVATITGGTGTAVNTVSAIRALNAGTTVFMNTPTQLVCATNAFNKAFGNRTPGSDNCFYIESDDRTQGIKCVTDGTVPVYTSDKKITFTGVVATQPGGQKVVNIQSINSAVTGTEPKPIGKVNKSVTINGTLVKVWGKVTSIVANSNPELDPATGDVIWSDEYITINDGSQTGDVKIPMHVQFDWMSGIDGNIGNLAVGHYVAVTGIAGTTTGSDVVVYPRNANDIFDYTASGK